MLEAWNASLESGLQASEAALVEAAASTEGLSYAYLKELGVSALMTWIRVASRGGMDEVLRSQVDVLRDQVRRKRKKSSEH